MTSSCNGQTETTIDLSDHLHLLTYNALGFVELIQHFLFRSWLSLKGLDEIKPQCYFLKVRNTLMLYWNLAPEYSHWNLRGWGRRWDCGGQVLQYSYRHLRSKEADKAFENPVIPTMILAPELEIFLGRCSVATTAPLKLLQQRLRMVICRRQMLVYIQCMMTNKKH